MKYQNILYLKHIWLQVQILGNWVISNLENMQYVEQLQVCLLHSPASIKLDEMLNWKHPVWSCKPIWVSQISPCNIEKPTTQNGINLILKMVKQSCFHLGCTYDMCNNEKGHYPSILYFIVLERIGQISKLNHWPCKVEFRFCVHGIISSEH